MENEFLNYFYLLKEENESQSLLKLLKHMHKTLCKNGGIHDQVNYSIILQKIYILLKDKRLAKVVESLFILFKEKNVTYSIIEKSFSDYNDKLQGDNQSLSINQIQRDDSLKVNDKEKQNGNKLSKENFKLKENYIKKIKLVSLKNWPSLKLEILRTFSDLETLKSLFEIANRKIKIYLEEEKKEEKRKRKKELEFSSKIPEIKDSYDKVSSMKNNWPTGKVKVFNKIYEPKGWNHETEEDPLHRK